MSCPIDLGSLEPLGARDPLVGEVFADRYVVEACIGEGATGRIYRASHRNMSRLFALKVLFGEQAANRKTQSRFAREAEAASRLSHPNVISVVDYGQTESGLAYLAMDYVEGSTLEQLIAEEGALSPSRAVELARQLARGLAHAHDRGLIHRDFKSSNVIVSRSDGAEIARILDFGIAKVVEEEQERQLTTDGFVMGTPAFMSPEQATGQEIDHRSDLFSLGIVLYHMLSGAHPFSGSPVEVARKNLSVEFPQIKERAPGVNVERDLEGIAFKLLRKDPAERFQSAQEILAVLERYAAGGDVSAAVAWESDARRRLGTGARVALLAAGALVFLFGGYLLAGLRGEERAESAAATQPAEVGAAEAEAEADAGEGEESAGASEAGAPEEKAAEGVEGAADERADTAEERAGAANEAGSAPSELDAGRAEPEKRRAHAAERPAARRRRAAKRRAAKRRQARSERARIASTRRELKKRYRSVASLLHRVASEKGEAAARPLKQQYRRISYADALRNDAVRSDAIRKLRALQRRARRLLR